MKKLLLSLPIFVAVMFFAPRLAQGYAINGHDWGSATSVKYYINPNNLYLPASDVITALNKAADAWHNQAGINIKYVYGGTTTSTVQGLDYTNNVIFRNSLPLDGCTYCGAETIWWYDGTGHLVDADTLYYEPNYVFYANNTGCQSNGEYVEALATHEFGHGLGLAHSTDTSATMYTYINYCETHQESLAPDDIAGIQSLYGADGRPTGAMDANPTTIPAGSSATLSWYTNGATSVSISPNVGVVPANGSVTVSPTVTTTYTMTATNAKGSATSPVYVNVGGSAPPPPPPSNTTLNLNYDGKTRDLVSQGESSTGDGQADAEFAVNLSASQTITKLTLSGPGTWDTVPGNGFWFLGVTPNSTGALVNNSSTNLNFTGSSFDIYASDASTPTYFNAGNTLTLTATFSDGTSASNSITIPTSNGQLPTASISASPTSINAGSSSTLTWTTSGATSVSIDNGIGNVSASGSTTVSPTATTTYFITATNAAGSTSASAQVTVNNPVPASHLNLAPSTLAFSGVSGSVTPPPQSVTLSNTGNTTSNWSASTNQAWCHVAPTFGSVNASSSTLLSVSMDAPSNIGTFNCNISITDPAADNSPQVIAVTYTVTGVVSNDTIAPTVGITSPINGATVAKRSTITISADATDDTGVVKVLFYVNGTLNCTVTTSPYTCAWKVPASPNKVYSLQAKAYDAAGNIGSSAIVKVTGK
jgi:hypothetical protein